VLDNDILNVLGRALFNQDDYGQNYGGSKGILPPSSQIVIEVRSDKNDQGEISSYSVYASMNDICMNVYNCGQNVYDCQVNSWIAQLQTEVYYTDMETTCADMSNL